MEEGRKGTDPVAAKIRPQLASSPYSAVLTRAEVDMRDAMLCASRYVGVPCRRGLDSKSYRAEKRLNLDSDRHEFSGTFAISNDQFC